jgi:hypothetical protein
MLELHLFWDGFSSWLVKVAFFTGQNSNARIAFILGRMEYIGGKWVTLNIYC